MARAFTVSTTPAFAVTNTVVGAIFGVEKRAMTMISTKGLTWLRAAAVGLLFGAFLSGAVVAQETPAAGAVQTAEDAVEEVDDGGFDDWGLLGLLGLAGLAGLRKREPEVREVPTAPRSSTTVDRGTTVVDRGETTVRGRVDDHDGPTVR